MALQSLAIVGKNDEPLYMREFRSERQMDDDIPEAELFGLALTTRKSKSSKGTDGFSSKAKVCSLRQQFILHAALDRFEELSGPPPGFGWKEAGAMGNDAMWVGLLCPVEDLRVYGYMTTTKVKLLAVVEDVAGEPQQNIIRERDVKNLFINVHRLYVEYTLNPFAKMGDAKIISRSFENGVQECVERFDKSF